MNGGAIMMIDYVTLMLINMTAGLFLLGCFVWKGADVDREDSPSWSPAFAIVGLVATVCGFVMTFTWPIPKPYGMAFGEMSVLLGVLFLGAALAIAKKWDLMPLAIYGFFAGAAATLLGVRIIDLSLTAAPILSGIGFILSGTAGIFSPFVVWQGEQKGMRRMGALVLFAASGIWGLTAGMAYWMHMAPAK
jgi:putative membrane protein